MIPWETLNPEQREAVEAWNEALLVMAPVGTGKTNVLALRAAHAVEQGVAPSSILCLSFTNKAAREVKDRLARHLGRRGGEVTAKTFHGLCAQILRVEAPAVGWDRDFLIYDEEDCRSILGEVARRANIKPPDEERDSFEFLLFDAAARARLSEFDDAVPRTPQQVFDACLRDSRASFLQYRGGLMFKPLLAEYVHALRECHAVDFADLIAGVNRLFKENPEVLERWQAKFSWIQVDEIQDTNRGEYRPLSLLAARHRRLSLFGDIDQTIYQWRGSVPLEILAEYKSAFAPVHEMRFTRNYRSTRRILEACERLIRACPGALTKSIVPQQAEEGEPLRVYEADDTRDEARWIRDQVETLVEQQGVKLGEIAVLTRSNFTSRELSRNFTALGLPHLQVDQFKFFQRAEIKETLAHLRLLLNPHDANSLMRFLKTPPKGIGEATIEALAGAPRQAGLKPADLLTPSTFETGDPFRPLMEAARAGRVVVFDIETTGLSIGDDEIVEIAAARCDGSSVLAQFHAYLKPSRPVGDSEPIHHLSDEFLAREGRDPAHVLREFEAFCEGCVLAGHNVALFDVPMVRSVCARLGLPAWEARQVFDTLDITRRFHRLPRYKLGEICSRLGLKSIPTHRADADVAATVELLQVLLPQLEAGAMARVGAVKQYGARFKPLADRLEQWRTFMLTERPFELLERILHESGLIKHYERDPADAPRREHLDELLTLFQRFDDPSMQPMDALIHVLSVASLGKEIDGQAIDEDKVLLLTVHQAKGLEFDTVFIAGAADGEFPNRRSVKEGLEDEEHRLFYVAVSRAKRRLYFSFPVIGGWGRQQMPSRYLRMVMPGRA
ncbi:3'-5' exonuclease [Paludibaculum fermentans]|uniref:DNA 3'-5' helicase n=1 Tax=Paludibaculum fermentans TaxID=1473598 RepID=A0A7S7SPV0_PALFE|nr:3'-5' exonuclease [Paludibaculum fermentans]QOY91540.1 UvrD-helicase domain-containing protein [Paludibaculum fermentans]